jgi:FtsZ-binding cell division protein ZapB
MLYCLPGILFLGFILLLGMFSSVNSELNEERKDNYNLIDEINDLKSKNDMLRDENENIKEESKDFKLWVKDDLTELVREYKDEGEFSTKDNLICDIKLLIQEIKDEIRSKVES